MSASVLAQPIARVRMLSDKDYGTIATHAESGALTTSSGDLVTLDEERLRLKASIDSYPAKSITVELSGPAAPEWLTPAMKSAVALLALQKDWDTYGAPPIDPRAVVRGLETLGAIMAPDSLPPIFVPTSAGGCQLEWHTRSRDLEIEITSEGVTMVFFDDRVRNAQGEGMLSENLESVKTMLRELI